METDHIFLLVYANNLFFVMVYGNASAGSNISRLVANMLMDWTSQMSKCVAAGCELNPVAAYMRCSSFHSKIHLILLDMEMLG